jgi:hypothetical protein
MFADYVGNPAHLNAGATTAPQANWPMAFGLPNASDNPAPALTGRQPRTAVQPGDFCRFGRTLHG